MPAKSKLTIAERFWQKVDKSGDCWLWTDYVRPNGYGQFWPERGRPAYAHRFSWELTHGHAIPEDHQINHACDNPRCVRPEHLVLGTHEDNMRDMDRKGRRRSAPRPGEANVSAKLTEDAVRQIRATKGSVTLVEWAQRLGVHPDIVWKARTGRSWKHVSDEESA